MSGWVPVETGGKLGWSAALAELQEAGVPLPPALAVLDLRMWQHRVLAPGSREDMPTGRELAKRWNWRSEKRVRLLLKREEEWSDPVLLDRWRNHRGRTEDATGTHAGRTGDAPEEGQTPNMETAGRAVDAPRTQGGRKKGDTRGVGSPLQLQEQEQGDPHPPLADGLLPLPEEPDNDGVPKWARLKGHRRHDVLGAVVRSIEAITQRTVNPDRCATDAKHVIALQRATGTPWADLAAQIAAVAEWARDSGDALAENDIRGMRPDGSAWGTDRSRSVATLTVQAKWADRLRAAEEWATPAQEEPVWHNDLCGPPRMRRASGPA